MDNLLRILDEGAFITSEEMAELAKAVRALQRDAERYKWLNKYTAHLFMCTEKGLDEQMDRAMGRGGMNENDMAHRPNRLTVDDDDIQEYKRPWIGMSDVEVETYSNVYCGISLARMIEALLKERNVIS